MPFSLNVIRSMTCDVDEARRYRTLIRIATPTAAGVPGLRVEDIPKHPGGSGFGIDLELQREDLQALSQSLSLLLASVAKALRHCPRDACAMGKRPHEGKGSGKPAKKPAVDAAGGSRE